MKTKAHDQRSTVLPSWLISLDRKSPGMCNNTRQRRALLKTFRRFKLIDLIEGVIELLPTERRCIGNDWNGND